jgi:hypothetical protein
MGWITASVAALVMLIVLVDAFEAMVLPRRVRHAYRLARVYFRSSWALWRAAARLLPAGRSRNAWLSVFGPLSLLGLVGVWAVGLIVAFALWHWSLEISITGADGSFPSYLYFSGVTFFTLGYGDLVPTSAAGRTLSVVEAGLGFGFLATVISYVPVLYQAFSRREITISLLDARAGSPPTAGEFLRRLGDSKCAAGAGPFLVEWERWAAELLESHLSYPVLSFYRSQHENQSWVGALTTILDSCAILIAGVKSSDSYQARLTFAMARHAAVDVALAFDTPPHTPTERLNEAECARLWTTLREAGLTLHDEAAAAKALTELRALYEPFVAALAEHFAFALPRLVLDQPPVDNWQTSAWTQRTPGLGGLPAARGGDDHFD